MISKTINARGVGVDIADIKRFERFRTNSKDNFLDKVFTKKELHYCFSFKNSASRLAGYFAAKEAVVKALGGEKIAVFSIEIRHNVFGKPEVWIKNKLNKKVLISISHAKQITCAVAVLV